MPDGEELYIVLIPDREKMEAIFNLQELVSRYYDMYRDNLYPQLHITIDRIKEEYLSETRNIVGQIATESRPVIIKFNRFSCFYLTDDTHLVLKVARTESLELLAGKIHNTLLDKGISLIDDYDDWIFHITIANNKFADNPIPLDDFNDICLFLEEMNTPRRTYAHRLEIWRPTLDPERKCVAAFNLEK